MVSSGMRNAGYVYVNIDDCWQGNRDEKEVIHPNAKFKDMKALAAYVQTREALTGASQVRVRHPSKHGSW